MKVAEKIETYRKDQINVFVMCSLLVDYLKVYSLVHLRYISERHNGFHYFRLHLHATWWRIDSALIVLASCESK
jgi:hypothetical protein